MKSPWIQGGRSVQWLVPLYSPEVGTEKRGTNPCDGDAGAGGVRP